MLSVKTEMSVGQINVMTSDSGGLSSEQLTDLAMDKIIRIADNAPPAIKLQAESFRDQLRQVVFHYIELSKREERATMTQELSKNGYTEVAEILRRL